MKNLKIPALLVLTVVSLTSFAQTTTIGTMSWLPQNPTVSDNVKLIVPVSFPNATCSLTTQQVDKTHMDSIIVTGYYCAENSGTCSRTDTFTLGQLTNGAVKIRFLLQGPHPSIGCANFQLAAIANTVITVGTSTGIKATENADNIKLYPNPTTGSFSLEYSAQAPGSYLVFYDAYGKHLKEVALDNSGSILLKESWESGYYFYRVESPSGNSGFQKLVIVR